MATRAELRANARIFADQENSTFPTDDQYNIYIDNAAREMWRKMLRAGWEPDHVSLAITANGATAYNISTSVSTVLRVYRVDGGARIAIPRVKSEDLPALESQPSSPALAYTLVGGAFGPLQIRFFPRPTSGSYEVQYVSKFPGFANDSGQWYGPDGSDELISMLAAIEGKDKEGDDTRALYQKVERKWREVSEHAGWTDAQGQVRVRDARQQERLTGPSDPFAYNASEGWT